VIQPLLARTKAVGADRDWAERLLKKGDWEEDGGDESQPIGFGMEKQVVRKLLKIGVKGGQVTEGDEMKNLLEGAGGDQKLYKERIKVLKDFEQLMSASAKSEAEKGQEDDDSDELTKAEVDALHVLEGLLYVGSEENSTTGKSHSEEGPSDGEKFLAMLEAESSESSRSHGRIQRSSSSSSSYGIPTLAMLLASASSLPSFGPKFFDVTPLERILRRAIETTLSLPSSPAQYPSNSGPTPNTSRFISDLIRKAKHDMIPEKTAPDLKQRSRGVPDRRDGSWRFMKVKPSRRSP
jgi:hypothetical protein